MPQPPASSDSPRPAGPEGEERPFPELTVGRGKLGKFAIRRLKASRLLQGSMAIAFVCYGALVFLVVSARVSFATAGIVVLLSLASWFFLFWWYPVLERTMAAFESRPDQGWIPRALEIFAIGCVVVVHVLMLVIVIVQAGEGSS